MKGMLEKGGPQLILEDGFWVSIITLGLGTGLLYSDISGGWFFLFVGASGLTQTLLMPRIGKEQASTIAPLSGVIVIVAAFLGYVFPQISLNWSNALIGSIISSLTIVILHGIFSQIRAKKIFITLKSLMILVASFALLMLYDYYLRQVFVLNALILFLSAAWFQQALNELLLSVV